MTSSTGRRTLAIRKSQEAAQQAALSWMRDASGVEVVQGAPGTTPERPWAVTAAKQHHTTSP